MSPCIARRFSSASSTSMTCPLAAPQDRPKPVELYHPLTRRYACALILRARPRALGSESDTISFGEVPERSRVRRLRKSGGTLALNARVSQGWRTESAPRMAVTKDNQFRRGAREAEGAPLLREYRVKSLIEGSNPSLSARDRKSTRLNSSHPSISYAVFCLK